MRRALIERRILKPEHVEALDDEAVIDTVFVPGYSTMDKVSVIAGQGAGMDAIREAAEGLGGRVRPRTTPPKGCVLEVCLPAESLVIRRSMPQPTEQA